jgi:hypothetical protein
MAGLHDQIGTAGLGVISGGCVYGLLPPARIASLKQTDRVEAFWLEPWDAGNAGEQHRRLVRLNVSEIKN